jgi:hypothetical protein
LFLGVTLNGCSNRSLEPSLYHTEGEVQNLPPDVQSLVRQLAEQQGTVTFQKTVEGRLASHVDLSLSHSVATALALAVQLPQVERLNLQGAKMTSDDFARLRQLTNLRWLDVSQSSVRDDDLTFLEGTPRLEFLLLWGTAVGDRGVIQLAQHSRLQKLDLSGTKITSEGIAPLVQMQTLLELNVEVPGLSASAVETLRQALPHAQIVN